MTFQKDSINSLIGPGSDESANGESSLTDVNLVYASTKFLKVYISKDFKQIMVTDEQEKFILIKDSKTFVKRNMRNLEGKSVLYA